MLDQDMYLSVACCDLQAIEYVAEILPEIVLNKRTGFQLSAY